MAPLIFTSVPVEIMVKVFKHLDLESALNFALMNRDTQGIFAAHRETLMLFILATELSPFDQLLQHVVSSPDDFKIRYGPCLRRSIYHGSKLISKGESPEPGPQESHPLLPPVMLDYQHFQSMIRIHRTVKDWEQHFPQYRFRDDPSSCRQLRPHEAERLRRALYHWMSFAYYFHGDILAPCRSVALLWDRDIRIQKLRLLTREELVELCDLWARVRTMVRCDICPSTEQVLRGNVSLSSMLVTDALRDRMFMVLILILWAGSQYIGPRSRESFFRSQFRALGHRQYILKAGSGRAPAPIDGAVHTFANPGHSPSPTCAPENSYGPRVSKSLAANGRIRKAHKPTAILRPSSEYQLASSCGRNYGLRILR